MQTPKFETKDSGSKDKTATGAKRDSEAGKGRPDLLPWEWIEKLSQAMENADPDALEGLKLVPVSWLIRLASLYGRGAKKYGANNWRKGFPLSRTFSSMMRHAMKWAQGWNDEDHLIAVIWNAITIIETEYMIDAPASVIPKEYADFGPNKPRLKEDVGE